MSKVSRVHFFSPLNKMRALCGDADAMRCDAICRLDASRNMQALPRRHIQSNRRRAVTDDLEALKVTASIDKTTSMLRRYNITKGRGGYPQSLELYAVQNVLDALTAALAEVKRLRDLLVRIEADKMSAARAADRYQKREKYSESYRALGIAEGLQAAAGYIRAALTQQSQAGGNEP